MKDIKPRTYRWAVERAPAIGDLVRDDGHMYMVQGIDETTSGTLLHITPAIKVLLDFPGERHLVRAWVATRTPVGAVLRVDAEDHHDFYQVQGVNINDDFVCKELALAAADEVEDPVLCLGRNEE